MYQKITYITKIEDAPEIRNSHLISLSEAAELLGVSLQTVDYHIRTGRLSAILAKDEYEKTSYERRRRWLLRSEVEKLKIDVIDNVLRGDEWRLTDSGDLFFLLPEVAQKITVKGKGKQIVRRITLNQSDTGDLEVDAQAILGETSATIKVDIQSERLYPNMEGIKVVLYLPDSQRSTTTNRQGLATFEDVPSIDLPLVRLKIEPPSA